MSSSKTVPVKSTHRFNVEPGEVFDTFLNPARAKKFMFSTVTGKMIRHDIDAREGGTFLFVDRRPEGDAAHYGKYIRLDRPRQIIFEFAVQKDAKEWDTVVIDIEPLKKGTQVTLTHHLKEDFAHLKDGVRQGWDGILDGWGAALRN